jgi:D-alanyl-D-alanine carboxypeptidase/D-alanyl-D-alanine-endopeptidase (penicillin-binding protein 4)
MWMCLALGASACATRTPPVTAGATPPPPAIVPDATAPAETMADRLDRVFDAPALARSIMAVRVTSLDEDRVLYERHAGLRVVPASVLKIVTLAAAAERLGWNHRFTTTLESVGTVRDGVLTGDLVVTGGGDPSVVAQDAKGSALFAEWADALGAAGITRVTGRLIGDDSAFDDEPVGQGWAWDNLVAGYAAPSGALSYNENVAVIRIAPGMSAGSPASVDVGPPGHGLVVNAEVRTGPAGSAPGVTIARAPGQRAISVAGQVPAGGATLVRTAAIENPTSFFVEALRLELASRGVGVAGGAADVDEVTAGLAQGPRRLIARRDSAPLSALAGYAMKVSQNFYLEMLLRAVGRSATAPGSVARGRTVVGEVLTSWRIPTDALILVDGSGLSRYNYASADLVTDVLTRVWRDERLRGPFVASLPVGGRDGTLGTRMRNTVLERQIQAKTGTLDNVRSLAGYLHTDSGRTLVFAMTANNFTAPAAQIDAVMERALVVLARGDAGRE